MGLRAQIGPGAVCPVSLALLHRFAFQRLASHSTIVAGKLSHRKRSRNDLLRGKLGRSGSRDRSAFARAAEKHGRPRLAGRTIADVPVAGKPTYPIFASEAIDKMAQDILLPLLVGKKHASLTNQSQPLAISWVRELLPELDRLYSVEVVQLSQVCDERCGGGGNQS